MLGLNSESSIGQASLSTETNLEVQLQDRYKNLEVQLQGGAGGGGRPGKDGKSAYEIALKNGFVGSEKEWLESLKGKDGVRGEQGLPGEKGEVGAKGQDGEKGENGITPNITIGEVKTLEPHEQATVKNVGSKENPVFDFGIPKGKDGKDGSGGEGSGGGLSIYAFEIDHEGNLILKYEDGQTPPNITLDEEGNLIYEI